jgi:hypothetical protein
MCLRHKLGIPLGTGVAGVAVVAKLRTEGRSVVSWYRLLRQELTEGW